jgi:SAM-dependent methyltransferase
MIDPILTRNLIFKKNGIWSSSEITKVSFPEDAHDNLFTIEDESFWFQHRNKCIIEMVKRFPPNEYIMDVGGGNGFVSLSLQKAGFEVIMLEAELHGVINAKTRGVKHILHTTFEDADFQNGSVDSIGLFDVLEHVENDHLFLTKTYNCMKKGGYLYLTLPAHKYLWSWTDSNAGHYRRYSINSILKLLIKSGFQIHFISYFFSGLSIPIFATRTLPTLLRIQKDRSLAKQVKSHTNIGGVVGRIVKWHWQREIERLKRGRILIGSSIIVVAEPVKHFNIEQLQRRSAP